MADTQTSKTEWIHCNKCLHKTKHSIFAEHSRTTTEPSRYEDYYYWWETTHTLLMCCGCESITLRRKFIFSEMDDGDEAKEEFYPPQVSRRLPDWHEELPSELQELLNEVYTALHSDSRRLALMGARTVIDMFVLDKIGDVGTFKQKLQALVENGYLGSQQRDILDVALDAGNAAAHRGYKPSPEVLNHVIDVVESLVQSYALEKASKSVKEAIPSRTRVTKTTS